MIAIVKAMGNLKINFSDPQRAVILEPDTTLSFSVVKCPIGVVLEPYHIIKQFACDGKFRNFQKKKL